MPDGANRAWPNFMELQAPGTWRTLDFISDLHLDASEPRTFEAWRRYMQTTPADAVFILGDLFEVWVGDDSALAPGFEADCAAVLKACASHASVFFMHGNRDFLVGKSFLESCGVVLLDDPTVLGFSGARHVLTHGDSLCLADTDYLIFRDKVRARSWQQNFLSKPLGERQAIGRDLRAQSAERKNSGIEFVDVDEPAALAWLEEADATTLVHGHTHKPADHLMQGGRPRTVLSDWDSVAEPARQQVLRLTAAGMQRITVD